MSELSREKSAQMRLGLLPNLCYMNEPYLDCSFAVESPQVDTEPLTCNRFFGIS